MRLAGNSQPEWGYMVPAPSFARTARIVVVAIAIGATAGAAVVLSLVGRSADAEADAGKAPVVVRTALLPAAPAGAAAETSERVAGTTAPTPSPVMTPAAATASAPPAQPVQVHAPDSVAATPSIATDPPASAVKAEAPAAVATPPEVKSGTDGRASVAALDPSTNAATPAQTAEDAAATDAEAAQKKTAKKRHVAGPYDGRRHFRNFHPFGPLLRHLFSARNGPSSYYH